MSPGRLLIFSGPSGVGKDTLLDLWMARNPRLKRVCAATTRAPRTGEREGVDYFFLSREEFERGIAAGRFLEHAEYAGNYYGTPVEPMEALLAEGLVAVLKIETQGALQVMEKRPEAVSIFILPPSLEVLRERIVGRGTEDPAALQRRLVEAENEIALSERYQFQIVNDDLETALADLEDILERS